MKICVTIILLLTFNPNCIAQYKEFEFKNLTTENGLPSNESYFIYRDSRNYLWFATDQGVARFNGSKMEKFDLPDNVVFKIYEDHKGRIWFFSHTGKLAYFYNEKIYPYKYNSKITKAFNSIIITNAFVNDEDELIINDVTRNVFISKNGDISSSFFLSDKKNDSTTFTISVTDKTTNRYFTKLNIAKDVDSGAMVINLNINSVNTRFIIPIFQEVSQQYGCVSINSKIFFLYYGRTLVRLNEDGTYKKAELPAAINCIELDRENLWVGFAKNGTSLLDKELNVLYNEPALVDKSVTSIRKDYEGGIWFATLEKGAFYLKNSHIKHVTGHSSLTQNTFCAFNMHDSCLLFGNKDGVFGLSNNKIYPFLNQKFRRISEIFTHDNKNIFVVGSLEARRCIFGEYLSLKGSYFKKALMLYSNSESAAIGENKYFINSYSGIAYVDVTAHLQNTASYNCLDYYKVDTTAGPGIVFVDLKNKLWRGTINGLYNNGTLTTAPVPFKPYDSLFNKGVTCIRQMINEKYVIGIRFGGIAIMQDTTVIARITEKDGLLSNSIKYLLPLKDQLWAATASGISIISFQSYTPVKYSITNIGRNDGLYDIIINQLLPFGNSIIAATSNGIYEIEEAGQFLNNRPKPIFFYINSVNYYKADTTGISSITLPYNNNRVVIKYSAVCFNLADELKYYYRFDNADTNWNEITSTELLLENLIPGNYTLQIKATVTGEKRFSEIRTLKITVEKPWWQNNWLKLLGLVVAICLGYWFLKTRINKISRREHQNTVLKTRMIELEQTALRSQMNPHFIFNCLTSIQQLIISGDKTAANEYLVKFARLIRKTLDLSARSFISVEEETDYLREYLVLEQLRIPGQFEFLIGVDKNINVHKTEIPGMMLQPIIENSIRHGIKHLENKNGLISISLKQQGAYILCTVIDNGVGRAKSTAGKASSFRENKSYGMEIVTRRLSAISFHHENEGTIQVEDLLNEDGTAAGTKVTMQVPFKTK